MAIDFKNIVFKYIKITGGTASIDTLMTDKIFNSTKPKGVYQCFIFPNREFSGVDYSDLQNLVSIEKTDIWGKIDRSAFLGFNAETNEFIVNHNAWLSAKDTDLKTDGELEHSGQAGWFITTINTTKGSNSKYEILQTDGSKAYLELKPIKQTPSIEAKIISGYPACVESELKSVLNQTLYKKNDALFAKCADDNSIVMVHDCVPSVSVSTGGISLNWKLERNNKEYTYYPVASARLSSYKFGKKIFSFGSTSSVNPINNYSSNVLIRNQTSNTDIELTYTTNINDILSSGEALTFYCIHKQKGFRYIYDKTSSSPHVQEYTYGDPMSYYSTSGSGTSIFSSHSNKSKDEPSCDLISCDTRKPFVYTPTEIIINNISQGKVILNSFNFIKHVPSGVIVIVPCLLEDRGRYFLLRFKSGDSVKYKDIGDNGFQAVNITGATMFGKDIYQDSDSTYQNYNISKSDVINGTGFTYLPSSLKMSNAYSGAQFLVTVLRV